jgi:deoxyribodipyrimidine photo-lyase
LSTIVVLFTRDLRVRDNAALAAAAADADRVVPVFVIDRTLLGGAWGTPNRLAFLRESLEDLDRSLRARGGRLVIRSGDPAAEAIRLARESDAERIYLSDDVSAYARRRQRRLADGCERERIRLRTFPGVTVVPPGELTPAGGDHYRVFTPYWRAWRAAPQPAPGRGPRRIPPPPSVAREPKPRLESLRRRGRSEPTAPGGESSGRDRLERWLRAGPGRYAEFADRLDLDATSRLSPYLHFGCLSAGEIVARVEDRWGGAGESAIRQLCWRDFHHQVLAARPDLPRADYRPRRRRWRTDEEALRRWRDGETGFPIVDAAMRQLAAEGWIHNRARLIVGSFLTKSLGIDWRRGAEHFESLLVDADLANNRGNWQWVAGTGNDTRPNRVLNPIRQARRFDPEGDYVRRWVPELEALEGASIHRPWSLEDRRRRRLAYPAPIIDPP